MPRAPRMQTDRFPYHVTGRSNNQENFYLPIEVTWEIFLKYLEKTNERYSIRVISFVLMSNHYHLLLHTPGSNLSLAMNYLMREVSLAIARETKRINHVFGGTFKSCLITDTNYIFNAYKYVYRNPVSAGICILAEEYAFSTLNWIVEQRKIAWFDDHYAVDRSRIPLEMGPRLEWLNIPYKNTESKAIQLALRRKNFSYPKSKDFRNVVSLLSV